MSAITRTTGISPAIAIALFLPLVVTSMSSAQENNTPIPQAQMGTLFPFIESLVPPTFPLSFTNPKYTDLEQWKRRARAEVIGLLHYNPPRVDPKPEVLERVDCGDYIRERLTFATTPNIRVPAYVLIPKGGPARKPAVLVLHDHGGFYVWGKEKVIGLENEHPCLAEFKRLYYGNRSVGNELVKRGYVVMAIDMFYWGERRMILPDDPPIWRDREHMTTQDVSAFNQRAATQIGNAAVGVFEAGTTWAGIMFTDDMRSLDYLASRPEVDPERVGCCGLSVGGFRSAHLAGLHPRVKAAVVVGWMCSYPAMLQNKLTSIGYWATIPGLQQLMDLPDVVSMHAPEPLMVIQGTQDGLFTNEGVQQAYDKIAAVYKKAGAPTHFKPVTYDGPHEFNADMQDKAYAFLDRYLKDRQ